MKLAEAKSFGQPIARYGPALGGFFLSILIVRNSRSLTPASTAGAAISNLLLLQAWIPAREYIFSFNLELEPFRGAFFYFVFPAFALHLISRAAKLF